ncbi:MAG: UvrD-helicase domain-containing protein, partial [Nitrospirota bacterium]|nr:UvrD-helicase domain-containing protein [Nitrospirota bacterium]
DKSMVPKAVLARISQAKNDNVSAAEFSRQAGDFLTERVAKIYTLYQKKLRETGCMDFGDLICEPIRMLKGNSELLARYHRQIRYILVDEYQDTNRAQYVFTNLLASETRNLFAVGDPDQSIYGWRGADINNMLDFHRDYPDAEVIKLEQNYRSTKYILSAANAVIEKNSRRLEKNLWTDNPEGNRIVFEESRDEHEEVRLVVNRLGALRRDEAALSYRDFAVFYRTNAQSRNFEEELIRRGIPYTIVGGVRFYDRMEIRDALSYLRLMANPNDMVSLRRAVNTPSRGVGPATFDKMRLAAAEMGMPLLDGMIAAVERGMFGKTRLGDFVSACKDFKAGFGSISLNESALRLLEDSGYMMMWQEENTEEAKDRIENIFELISAIKDYETAEAEPTLTGFLDHVALISDIDAYDEQTDRLTLMTIHSAKGLEFNTVFLTGMEEGLFPHSRSAQSSDELEEERRLCYVAMTRAMERLYVYASRMRTVYGEARYQARSRFVDEMPSECVDYVEVEPARQSRESKHVDTGAIYYTSEDSQVNRYNDAVADTDISQTDQPWKIGMRVIHPIFGLGVVRERTGKGEDIKLVVRFETAGVKKLAVKYASLTPAT